VRQVRNEGWARGAQFPGRQISIGGPNHCGGAEKSHQCHKHFLQNGKFASERAQVEIWGRQACFLRQTPSNLVTPLVCCNYSMSTSKKTGIFLDGTSHNYFEFQIYFQPNEKLFNNFLGVDKTLDKKDQFKWTAAKKSVKVWCHKSFRKLLSTGAHQSVEKVHQSVKILIRNFRKLYYSGLSFKNENETIIEKKRKWKTTPPKSNKEHYLFCNRTGIPTNTDFMQSAFKWGSSAARKWEKKCNLFLFAVRACSLKWKTKVVYICKTQVFF